MNLALSEVLDAVAPNVGDSGACVSTDRQKVVDAINRSQRLLITRLDSKGTVWPRCVPVCKEVFALPPEFVEVRSVMVNGHPAIQRDQYFEGNANIGHRGEASHWQHYCHGHELMDLGDGWAIPTLLPQIPDAHLALTCQLNNDAGVVVNMQVLTRYGDWVTEPITLLADQKMAYTQNDCYDVRFAVKPLTVGNVNVYQVAPNNMYTLQAIYGPKVTSPSYRRKRLPKPDHHRPSCRHDTLKLMGKLRYYPAEADSDQLIIGNLDAIIWGVKAVTAQTMGSADDYQSFLALAEQELLNELRDDESEATVSPVEVSTGVSFNSRRSHRYWH
ncbi:MAG TPA: hypothetical protein VMQ76_12650 [Terracidiphilus sp.]|nr:hypothetical protein [Terracidiphilus sp.]